jgi:arylsulfatase
MEVYAAQIDRMDQGIGLIIEELERTGQLDNTLIFFLADNGGCAEEQKIGPGHNIVRAKSGRYTTKTGEPVLFGNNPEVMPGEENTYQSYGQCWANLSNTPFRLYKHWVHEGGIATPFIVHWPERVTDKGALRHAPAQLPDVMATIVEATGAPYLSERNGLSVPPMEGGSLLSVFEQDGDRGRPLFWEHEGNSSVRLGQWKLVKRYPGDWELYDIDADRTELNDLAAVHPERVAELSAMYETWAKRCGVIPREVILEIIKKKNG